MPIQISPWMEWLQRNPITGRQVAPYETRNIWWQRTSKPIYRSIVTKETALNAGIARALNITDAQVRNYGPFVRFHIENRSAEIIGIYFNCSPLGDNTIQGTDAQDFVNPGDVLDLTPYEDGTPDISFTRIAIKNLSATNTSNDEVTWWLGNR